VTRPYKSIFFASFSFLSALFSLFLLVLLEDTGKMPVLLGDSDVVEEMRPAPPAVGFCDHRRRGRALDSGEIHAGQAAQWDLPLGPDRQRYRGTVRVRGTATLPVLSSTATYSAPAPLPVRPRKKSV